VAPGDRETAPDRFVPPAPWPHGPDPWLPTLALRMMRSQIEGWPKAVFEDDAWQPPVPGAPLFVMTADAVRTVLHDDADNFTQGALFRRMMRPAWGEGMLIAQGPEWRAQRQAASPAFRPAEMAKLSPYFARAAEATAARWAAAPCATVNIEQEMQRLTFDIILETMLSGAADFDRAAMSARIGRLFAQISGLRFSYLLAPDRYHDTRPSPRTPDRAQLLRDIGVMIARRRTAPPEGDLVDMLMKARDPQTDAALSDSLLADNLLGFIIAGHETTASTLTWALFLLAAHPPTLQRVREEVAAVAGNEPIGPAHVGQLVFVRQVVSETMRLFPAGFLLTRVAHRATTLAGRRVAAGQRVNVPVYAIHRRPGVFPDPHAFLPERFAPDRPAPDRFAYLPFGAGPRICIGAAFASAEMVTVLATLVRRVDLTPPPMDAVWPVAQLGLTPRNGMPIQVHARST